ncbi:MAG: hypothetical protein ACR2M8_12325 [Pyrinomonadaceae bacterium]
MEKNKSGIIPTAKDLSSQIAKNFLMGVPAVRRWRLRRPRTSIATEDINQFLATYAFSGLGHLLEHTGDLRGKTVCEIGPGDFLTSGLSILAAGADRYAVIDRFAGDYFGESAKRWYALIEENWASFYPDIPWDSSLDSSKFPEDYRNRLELIGDPIETAVTSQKYDIVCSFQVGEHVSSLDKFAEIHQRILKPEGVGLHRVDFSAHDVWSHYHDPGTFLRFPEFIWNLTGSNRGVPNRYRHHEFLEAFERARLDVEILAIDYTDPDKVDFNKLNKRFRSMPKESVLAESAIYRLKRRPS